MHASYTKNLDLVIRKIERARLAYDPHHIVSLLAVSKYATIEQIQILHECGQRAFGENKVQDLKQKSQALESLPLEWHMIGTLQENKINALIDLAPTLLHSLDSLNLRAKICAPYSSSTPLLNLAKVACHPHKHKNSIVRFLPNAPISNSKV